MTGLRRAGRLFLNAYVQIALGALTVTASELLMKVGANSRAGDIGVLGIAALASGVTWIAIILYCLSFLSWVRVLQCLPLGMAFGLISVVHVLIPIGCAIFLHEAVSPQRWLGILLVLAGLMMMVGPVAKLEEKLETRA
ncbi:MAG: hypothetical protein ABSH22_08910 [Tepidisphaeraceae bacterium]|jgi:drug/metabolite transporter (DMT)-like permease